MDLNGLYVTEADGSQPAHQQIYAWVGLIRRISFIDSLPKTMCVTSHGFDEQMCTVFCKTFRQTLGSYNAVLEVP